MAKIAMMVGPEFEDSEFRIPYDRLKAAHHEITVLGTAAGQTLKGKKGREETRVDAAVKDRSHTEFDLLVIPGGHSPDNLRIDRDVVSFVREFANSGKPVAAICHGPQLLIEAGLVAGRNVTSWPSVRKDLENAGANWIDRDVVRDGTFITSRKPEDLEVFSKEILAALPS